MAYAWLNLDGDDVLAGGAGVGYCAGLPFLTPVFAMNEVGWWECLNEHVHWVIFDLGTTKLITQVRGRSEADFDPIDIDIYISDTIGVWGTAVATGIDTWADNNSWVVTDITDKQGRYVMLVINDTEGELDILEFGDLESYFAIFDVYGGTPPVFLTGTIDITSTTAGVLKVTKKLTGTIAVATTCSGDLSKDAAVMIGSLAIDTSVTGSLSVTKKFTGTVAIETTVDGNLISAVNLVSTPLAITTTVSGVLTVSKQLVGAIAIETTVDGALGVSKKLNSTTIAIVTTTSGVLKLLRKISRTSTLYSTASGSLSEAYLVGTIAITTTTSGVLSVTKKLVAVPIEIQTTVGGFLYEFERLSGTIAITTTVTGNLSIYVGIKEITGSIAIQTSVTGTLIVRSPEIPPFMEADLIDPFSGGAWLWLVQIAVPGETTQRIARNTADTKYDGNTFDKFNLQIGEQVFTGDGSIPRVTLRIFQDINRRIEDLINDTEGALGAAVKLIRVNERFLETPVSALEADYDNLAASSDSEWTTFTLGMPNPLTQRFPLRIYSSSMCPWATPTLFKGPDCQLPLVHGDTTCTGTYEDCYGKGNAVHYGAELGLDPAVVRI